MRIREIDVEKYEKYELIKGTGVFANALTERLRELFPTRDIRVNHRDPYHQPNNRFFKGEYVGRQIVSKVYEVIGKKFGFLPRKRLLAILAADRDMGGDLGVTIPPIDLKQSVQKEVERLNKISRANKRIDLVSEEDFKKAGEYF